MGQEIMVAGAVVDCTMRLEPGPASQNYPGALHLATLPRSPYHTS
jgi:hypothetical protein